MAICIERLKTNNFFLFMVPIGLIKSRCFLLVRLLVDDVGLRVWPGMDRDLSV